MAFLSYVPNVKSKSIIIPKSFALISVVLGFCAHKTCTEIIPV